MYIVFRKTSTTDSWSYRLYPEFLVKLTTLYIIEYLMKPDLCVSIQIQSLLLMFFINNHIEIDGNLAILQSTRIHYHFPHGLIVCTQMSV